MDILLANPRGFCAGVDRAISIVESALEKFGAPIYVRHEVVHNRYVVNKLKEAGAVFVEELDEVPDDSIVIFSAHGVAKTVREMAKSRALKAQGIPTAIYYPKSMHQQTAYKHYPTVEGGLPVSEKLSADVISLPMHAYLDQAAQDRVIKAVRDALS